jgi:hypothetical protein
LFFPTIHIAGNTARKLQSKVHRSGLAQVQFRPEFLGVTQRQKSGFVGAGKGFSKKQFMDL